MSTRVSKIYYKFIKFYFISMTNSVLLPERFFFLIFLFSFGLFSCQMEKKESVLNPPPKGYSSIPFDGIAIDQERKDILFVIDRFMEGVSKKDTTIIKEILEKGIQKIRYVVRTDTTYFNRIDSDTSFQGFLKIPETFQERYWDATVMSNGYIASVWAPYDFYTDGNFSHCGVDLFFMVRKQNNWKIAHYGYTVDQKNCFPDATE